MKNLILWTLSFLLGFNPALMAAGNARQNNEIKAFIEMTGVTKRSVSFRELYSKISPYLPQAQKEELTQFIREYGDMKLPKLDATKIKISGSPDEAYSLQVVTKGESGSIQMINDQKEFARINGTTVTAQDLETTATFMQKLGLPSQEVADTFRRAVPPKDGKFNAMDLSRVSKSDQAVYFKQTRELLASMEAVQAAEFRVKTSMLAPSNKYEVVLNWLRGEDAFAMEVGQKCTAAGYSTTEVGYSNQGPTKRLTCGTDGDDGVPEQFREKAPGKFCESKNDFACNPVVFGVNQSKEAFCVKAGPNTTSQCTAKANESGTIMPNLSEAKNRDALNAELAKIKEASKAVLDLCLANESASKGKKKSAASGLISDQTSTCGEFRKHAATIDGWDCEKGSDAFKKTYEAQCKAKAEEQRPAPGTPVNGGADQGRPGQGNGTTPAAPGTPGADGRPAGPTRPPGEISCDKLPKKYSTTSGCAGGSQKMASADPDKDKAGFTVCDDGKKKYAINELYWCDCGKGVENPDYRTCKNANGKKDKNDKDSDEDSNKNGFWKKNKKWLIPLGFGLLGLGLFHWLAKQNVKQQYQYLEPEPPAKPPVAPPAAPVPRGTN